MQKRHRAAASQISIWAMIGWNFRSDWKVFRWVEEVDKQYKNRKKRVQNVRFGGPMTQDMYSSEILPLLNYSSIIKYGTALTQNTPHRERHATMTTAHHTTTTPLILTGSSDWFEWYRIFNCRVTAAQICPYVDPDRPTEIRPQICPYVDPDRPTEIRPTQHT